MDRFELQRLKIAWLAAKESGDTQTQMQILREHPDAHEQLIDFIAAYSASGGSEPVDLDSPILPLTERAYVRVLDRAFPVQTAAAFANLSELRKSRNLSKVDVAKGLRLGVDVWNKFEEGAVELVSLSQRQLERLATFFQVGIDQFSTLLNDSQAISTLNRRQTAEAARNAQQGPQKQSFADAIARSKMPKEDKQFWLEQ
jgi:transcriptional regulator with XRE-family HTH domain